MTDRQTDRRTESDTYELTMQCVQVPGGLKNDRRTFILHSFYHWIHEAGFGFQEAGLKLDVTISMQSANIVVNHFKTERT